MKRPFTVGYRVTWNSETGHVSGTIIKVHPRVQRSVSPLRTSEPVSERLA
jgi:hypothetical protein